MTATLDDIMHRARVSRILLDRSLYICNVPVLHSGVERVRESFKVGPIYLHVRGQRVL